MEREERPAPIGLALGVIVAVALFGALGAYVVSRGEDKPPSSTRAGTNVGTATTRVFVGEGMTVPAGAPGQALPPSGQPPADAEGVREAVRAAFRNALSGDAALIEQSIDDPEGIAANAAELRKRFPQTVGESQRNVVEVVFTSPTRAAFTYTIRLADGSPGPSGIGGARLVDGRWLITRATVCRLQSMGGAVCR